MRCGPKSPVVVPVPCARLLELFAAGFDLDTLKREYIRAAFYETGSIRQAAKALKIDRQTVSNYLEDERLVRKAGYDRVQYARRMVP